MSPQSIEPVVASSARFDWTMTMLGGAFMGGGILDIWAHNHQSVAGKIETFFTPWHAILYAGWLAVAIFLLGTVVRNHAHGSPWRRTLPRGYGLSLLGVVIFTWGGPADMLWHILFGLEEGLEGTYSPTHLVLGIGLTLIVSGPLRAAGWRLEWPESWIGQLPAAISLGLTLTELTTYLPYAHPLTAPWAATDHRLRVPGPAELALTLGMTGILVHAGVLMGAVLAAVLRCRIPLGGLTLAFALNGGLMVIAFWAEPFRLVLLPLVAVVGTGIIADLLLRWLRPSSRRRGALRLFTFFVPALFYLAQFLALMLTGGIWWSTHLWTGAVALAGIVGVLLSYAFVPPARPGAEWA